jgi:Tol biopolymer transport system component
VVAMLFAMLVVATGLVWSSRAPAAFPGKDGRILLSSDRDGNFEIWSMKPDGSGARQLTNNGYYNDDAKLSPDATKIAYRAYDGSDADVYAMNPDGSGPQDLTNNPGYDSHPSWSPSGKRIVFESGRSGTDQLYLMNANGSKQHPVKLGNLVQYDPVFTPDGKRIIFSGGNGHLYDIHPDGSHRRRLTNSMGYDDQRAPDRLRPHRRHGQVADLRCPRRRLPRPATHHRSPGRQLRALVLAQREADHVLEQSRRRQLRGVRDELGRLTSASRDSDDLQQLPVGLERPAVAPAHRPVTAACSRIALATVSQSARSSP